MSVLGHDSVTANGTVVIPDGCVYVVALCVGSVDPPYLNGNMMQTKASVPAQGVNAAVSIHVSTFPIIATLPFVMNGADSIDFVYLDDAVCTRADVVSGYTAAGSLTGALATSINDLVIGIVLGNNGQVAIKGDNTALTLITDSLTVRTGYIVPGDSNLSCEATDQGTLSGYWYQPPAVWVDTSTSVLVEAGHYEFNPVAHYVTYSYSGYYAPTHTYYYDVYDNGTNTGQVHNTTGVAPSAYTYYTYPGVWVPDRYETQSSGYWSYPSQVWVETGQAGNVSAAFISVADVMIGGIYVSRPLIC